MRLIDADRLRKKLLMMECMEDVVEVIDSQPIAYDIDKVIEEIKDAYGCYNCEYVDTMTCNECVELEILNDICEIIKESAKNDK